ncbi:MAG: hypothetical protein EHM93_04275 [Bacteroidales bacterium]|nr:MAG: hypothetical protein EHM93_04275 [Bacteroidales bacterium]
MNKIVVIGTQPPCPRCKLLTNVLIEKVKETGINAEVRHLAYTDEESKLFAKSIGLETGTAKDVSKRIGITIESEKISSLIRNYELEENKEYKNYNDSNWSFELDDFLRPFEQKAKSVGILMTPILIINSELKHNGSLPRIKRIEDWILELKNISNR